MTVAASCIVAACAADPLPPGTGLAGTTTIADAPGDGDDSGDARSRDETSAPPPPPSNADEASEPIDGAAELDSSLALPDRGDCLFDDGVLTRQHAGFDRQVLVAAAATASSSTPGAALLLFHGFAGAFDTFVVNTGLATEGPAAGVTVLAPAGLGDPPDWGLGGGPSDDAGFVAGLVDDLVADPCIDPNRIWLAGYSAGAGFAGLQACGLSNRIAGLVMNAAEAPALCADQQGYDVIVSHGTADLVVPYTGLTLDGEGTTLPSAPELTAGWATALGCGPETAGAIGEAFDQRRWTGCGDGTNTVDLLTYVGGGHRWPGRPAVGGEGLVATAPDLTCVVLAAVADIADPVADCAGTT